MWSNDLNLNKRMKGVSLLEVLISVVVLSIGMLGMAALQANATRYHHSAELRTVASHQITNMLDRIRANKAGADAGNYNNLSGTPADPGCSTCTASQIATRDLSEWNTDNALLLPSGQGTVVNNGGTFTITIYWDNNRSGAAGLNCSGNLTVDLSCIQVSTGL